MQDFVALGTPLSQTGFDAALNRNQIVPAALWAVLSVETSGSGYLADRRPKILFERHIFSKLTNGAFDQTNPGISNPVPGGYGASGAPQYDRLQEALALDNDSALKSASWGLGQIMGLNYASAGFGDVGTMVAAMVASEDGQLEAMAAFINANGMGPDLQSLSWSDFARKYNGPNYSENNYDGKLQTFYAKYTAGNAPDLSVRAVQTYLTYKGFPPLGGIDGIMGLNTANAIKAFQTSTGMPVTGAVDVGLMIALTS